MQIVTPVITPGFLIALLVVLIAILGMIGLVPDTPLIVFGMLCALGIARLT